MDSVKAGGKKYKFEMKFCEPKKRTEKGDWFTHDSSSVDFTSLKATGIDCGEYFDNGTPASIAGEEEKGFNRFKFSNQVFAWEKILVLKISDQSSRGWSPDMYIVMPIKYKSFVTHIALSNLSFQPGKVIILTNYKFSRKGMSLAIEEHLGDHTGVDIKDFFLRSVLEEK